MRFCLMVGALAAAAACGDPALKAEGEECFATSECAAGFTCNFGEDPPKCRSEQTGGGEIDAAAPPVDAAPAADAAPGGPDAPPPADAAPSDASIDAAPPDASIDAAPPDASIDAAP